MEEVDSLVRRVRMRKCDVERLRKEIEIVEDETHCRFGFDMGFPCQHFLSGAVCGLDKPNLCDLETEKGRKFLREYECEDV